MIEFGSTKDMVVSNPQYMHGEVYRFKETNMLCCTNLSYHSCCYKILPSWGFGPSMRSFHVPVESANKYGQIMVKYAS